MAQDFSKLYLIVDWRDDVLMDFVDDLTLEHIEGQLLWKRLGIRVRLMVL